MRDLVFASVSRAPSLVDQVYAMLREELRAGAFQAGERMVDSVLAKAMSVSRTPVREALSRLVADGLLDAGEGGVRVPVVTLEAMEEIVDIRRMLEPPAAARVAASLDDAARDALTTAVAAARCAEKDQCVAGFLKANYQFRGAWVGRIANQRLREAILRFDDQAGAVRRVTLAVPAARHDAVPLLEEWLDAFLRADPRAASRCALAYLDAGALHFRQVVESERAAMADDGKWTPAGVARPAAAHAGPPG